MVRFRSDPVRRLPIALAFFCGALTAQAPAQPAPRPAKADPLDAAASVPGLRYTSSFAQYRGLRDEKPVEPSKGWREANQTVGRIGGWRAYAREAQQAEPAAAPASAPQPGDKP
jgi:hypothetical protein